MESSTSCTAMILVNGNNHVMLTYTHIHVQCILDYPKIITTTPIDLYLKWRQLYISIQLGRTQKNRKRKVLMIRENLDICKMIISSDFMQLIFMFIFMSCFIFAAILLFFCNFHIQLLYGWKRESVVDGRELWHCQFRSNWHSENNEQSIAYSTSIYARACTLYTLCACSVC